MNDHIQSDRDYMVDSQLVARDITNEAVLKAMREVPRERFVPEDERGAAYLDGPLPIGHGQTISQPYIVAYMIQALEPEADDVMLEIGAGSGYAAAVLSRIVAEVHAVERIEPLCKSARKALADLGYDNVHIHCADGTRGWAEAGPFDGIVVAAGGPEVPQALRDQLAVGGRLVIPIGSTRSWQQLVRVTRTGEDEFETEHLLDVRFVPLIGEEGWRD